MERYISERILIATLLDYEVSGPNRIAYKINSFLHGELPAAIHALPGIYIDEKTKEIK